MWHTATAAAVRLGWRCCPAAACATTPSAGASTGSGHLWRHWRRRPAICQWRRRRHRQRRDHDGRCRTDYRRARGAGAASGGSCICVPRRRCTTTRVCHQSAAGASAGCRRMRWRLPRASVLLLLLGGHCRRSTHAAAVLL